LQSTPKTAGEFAETAAKLVTGDRDRTHGDKETNFADIAALWDAYLWMRRGRSTTLDARDVAAMMMLLKLARTQHGEFNPDDYIDMIGYAACGGELATKKAGD
jgi:hypothetical protein